jgi:hypothetical protein
VLVHGLPLVLWLSGSMGISRLLVLDVAQAGVSVQTEAKKLGAGA